MPKHTSATVPAVGSFSRRSARHWTSRAFLDRPFALGERTGHPAHVAALLPPVLRKLASGATREAQP